MIRAARPCTPPIKEGPHAPTPRHVANSVAAPPPVLCYTVLRRAVSRGAGTERKAVTFNSDHLHSTEV